MKEKIMLLLAKFLYKRVKRRIVKRYRHKEGFVDDTECFEVDEKDRVYVVGRSGKRTKSKYWTPAKLQEIVDDGIYEKEWV